MENIAPIQIAEPKREKRAAVTAAYRRGYADALEDMRKRQREKKRRRQYFIIQKLNGIALLAFTALAVYILEGDATIAILTVPLALYMIFSREMCIVNRYYWETKERDKRNDKNFRAVRGIGSPRCAMRNIGIPVKAIDYVEIDEKAVRSYNAMFSDELEYKTQSVVGWNLKPDILIHGSPCQDFSIAGHQGKATAEAGRINRGKGADKGSGTRSSLMWETIHIIEQMGEWKPKYVIWENVKNVLSRYMRVNFNRYLSEMERLGYSNNFEVLDAREFGLPQARERVFTVSVLGNEKFSFDDLIKTPMRDINDFLLSDAPPVYDVTQPSVLEAIGKKGIRRATIIEDYAFTITARQDRTPAQVIDMGNGRYRYLTELECWRLQGYTDEDFNAAAAVHKRVGRYIMPLYKQAGNSIPVPIFESLFRKMILHETAESGVVNGYL